MTTARRTAAALMLYAWTMIPAAAAEPPPASALPVLDWCDVVAVTDGDTLRMKCDGAKVKVRLYCIDAPETDQDPWGETARAQLVGTVTGRVQVVVKAVDRYRRPVVEIRGQDGTSPGLALVTAGVAAVYPRYCTDQAYLEAEASARAAGAGIWSTPGLQQTPWVWRRHRGQ